MLKEHTLNKVNNVYEYGQCLNILRASNAFRVKAFRSFMYM